MANADDHRRFVYRCDAQNRIVFLNEEWIDFARENEAPELTAEYVLGQPLERFIAGWETRHLYELIYQSVRQRGREVRIPFACDSPSVRRSFQMRLAPLEKGELEFTVEVIAIEPIPLRPLLDNRIEHSSQVVVICSWCKRIRIALSRWVAIEDAVEKKELFGTPPPSLTHDVCPDCFATIRRQIDEP
jgi:hypothetical protein